MTPPIPGPAQASTPPDERVAEVLHRLDELDGRPVAEHVEVFDTVHRTLQDALATLDEA